VFSSFDEDNYKEADDPDYVPIEAKLLVVKDDEEDGHSSATPMHSEEEGPDPEM